jgi:hypothetical protein
MPLAAVVTVGADDRLILRSPYDPALVDALKEAIPRAYREWDAGAKVWRIDPDWGDVMLQALTAIGVSVVDKRPSVPLPTTVASALQEACQRLYILPEAPVEVAEAAYKALARLHHPDVGGDTETMQALNDAIATFKSFNEVPF